MSEVRQKEYGTIELSELRGLREFEVVISREVAGKTMQLLVGEMQQ